MAKARKGLTPAVAYLRTSSATNVGADKDSETRQRQAITARVCAPYVRKYIPGLATLGGAPGALRSGHGAVKGKLVETWSGR